ncbi:MAG TPA: SRPBCC domain-containing protein [Puia sp.]|nr:SRPBCC domain-containing protein [Puia sp.]
MQSIKENNTADRELIFSRLLDAPIKLVWKVWTSPEHIVLWWGPEGFTNSITKMDVRPGGEWNLTMHGPDGTDYITKCVFREIVKHKKIVYEQFAQFRYISTIQFESRGEKTYLHWQLLFESRQHLIDAAKIYGADKGLQQTGERLVNYLLQFDFQ